MKILTVDSEENDQKLQRKGDKEKYTEKGNRRKRERKREKETRT